MDNKRPRSRKIIWFNAVSLQFQCKNQCRQKVSEDCWEKLDKNSQVQQAIQQELFKSELQLPTKYIISSHNKKVLTDITPSTDQTCNCQKKDTCPLSGKWYNKSVIYLCNVKSSEQDEGMNYIGLTENTSKESWYQHRNLFKYVWSLKEIWCYPCSVMGNYQLCKTIEIEMVVKGIIFV